MTHRGGWEVVERVDERPEEPAPDELPPGRWRCARRRDGRIDRDGVEWTVETADAADAYRRTRYVERGEEWLAWRRQGREATAGEGGDDGSRATELAEEALRRYVDGEVDAERAEAVVELAARLEE